MDVPKIPDPPPPSPAFIPPSSEAAIAPKQSSLRGATMLAGNTLGQTGTATTGSSLVGGQASPSSTYS